MTTELQTTTQQFTIQPISFDDVPHAVIEQLAERYLPLKIKSVHDKSGLRRVQAGRETLHELTRKIEKRRKELKADALDYCQKVDESARTLQALIDPIAGHLQQLEHDNARERTRLERDAAGQRVAMIRERLELLAECGWTHYTPADVGPLSQEQFDELLSKARAQTRATSKPIQGNHNDTTDTTPAGTTKGPKPLAAKLEPLARASRAEDMAKLMHVANLVALIEVPQVMTKAAEPWAREVATLLANCAERIRRAATQINTER